MVQERRLLAFQPEEINAVKWCCVLDANTGILAAQVLKAVHVLFCSALSRIYQVLYGIVRTWLLCFHFQIGFPSLCGEGITLNVVTGGYSTASTQVPYLSFLSLS